MEASEKLNSNNVILNYESDQNNGYWISSLRALIWEGPGVKGGAYDSLHCWAFPLHRAPLWRQGTIPVLKELTREMYKTVKIVWDSTQRLVLSPGHLPQVFLKCCSSQKMFRNKQPCQNLLKDWWACLREGDDDKNKGLPDVKVVCWVRTSMCKYFQKIIYY